jgi:nitric oxide reductase large subunit
MVAFFLFVLAVAGGVVVGNLVWENTTAAEITVFGQPVTGYSQGWLLAMAATLGFVVALLLVASVGVTKGRRERRRQLRMLRRSAWTPTRCSRRWRCAPDPAMC